MKPIFWFGLFVFVVMCAGFGHAANALELRVTTSLDLVNCASGVALAAGPDAGKVPAPGDTCVLDPGTYTLPVVVTLQNLKIFSRDGKLVTRISAPVTVAAGINGVTLGGPGVDQGVAINGAAGVGLTVLSIDNFTLQNSDVINNAAAGIVVGTAGSVRNFQFLNVVVRGNAGAGLSVLSTSSVSNLSISDATFESNTGSHISFANGGEVSGFALRNSTLRTAGGGGSGVLFAAAVTDVRNSDISNTMVEGNAAFGVRFANGGRVQGFSFADVRCNSNVGGNAFFSNGGDVSDVDVDGSSFSRSGAGFGMGFANGGGVEGLNVADSEFDQNATVGFAVAALPDDFADSRFTGNRFRNNVTHGFFAGLTTNSIKDLDFRNNDFSQNTMVGAFLFTTLGDIAGLGFDGDRFTKNGTLGLDVNTGVGPVPGAGDIGEFTFSNVVASENGAGPGTGIRLMSLSDGDVVNVDVTGSDISNNGGFGLQLASMGGGGTTPGEVDRVTIQNTTLNANGTRAAAGLGSGLMLFGRKVGAVSMTSSSAKGNNDHGVDAGATDSVSDVTISGGEFSNNDRNVDSIGDGVRINAGAGGTVNGVRVENAIANNNDSGIVVDVQGRNGTNITVQNNAAVNQNKDVGIGVMSAEDLNGVLIAGNTVEGNAFNIVVRAAVDGSGIVVRDNKLTGASGTGVLSDSAGVSINSNDIRKHTTGVDVKKSDNVRINNNNLVQNTTGVDASGLGPGKRVDATRNWWGEPSGPSGAGPGIGDRVGNNVDFQPFLTAPAVATGANFVLSEVTVPSQVGTGQVASIGVTVTNQGSEEGTQEVKIRVLRSGNVVAQQDARTATLNPAGSVQLSFQVALADGTYTVEISTDNDTVTRSLTVGSGSPPSGGSIEQALDANNNNRIDDAEIIRAVQLWITAGVVPGTGQTIGDAKILRLIQLWIGGGSIS